MGKNNLTKDDVIRAMHEVLQDAENEIAGKVYNKLVSNIKDIAKSSAEYMYTNKLEKMIGEIVEDEVAEKVAELKIKVTIEKKDN